MFVLLNPSLFQTTNFWQANFGDDSQDAFNLSFAESDLAVSNKEADSMSASFYAEQGDPNPFVDDENDLNKVHELPDNVDDFIHDVLMNNKENLPPVSDCTNSTRSTESPLGECKRLFGEDQSEN